VSPLAQQIEKGLDAYLATPELAHVIAVCGGVGLVEAMGCSFMGGFLTGMNVLVQNDGQWTPQELQHACHEIIKERYNK
jgi:hypothetical protein